LLVGSIEMCVRVWKEVVVGGDMTEG